MILSDLKWRFIFLVTGERPAPRTTSKERTEAFKEMVHAGMGADDALGILAHLTVEELNTDPPPWA